MTEDVPRVRWWTWLELLAVTCVLAGFVAAVTVSLPNRLRVLGVLAVVAGGACGWGIGRVMREFGISSRAAAAGFGAATALAATFAYGAWNAQRFERAERPRDGREELAQIMLEQLPAEVRSKIAVHPVDRWVRWRVRQTGLQGSWPWAIAGAEVALAAIIGGVVAFRTVRPADPAGDPSPAASDPAIRTESAT